MLKYYPTCCYYFYLKKVARKDWFDQQCVDNLRIEIYNMLEYCAWNQNIKHQDNFEQINDESLINDQLD